MNAAIPVMRAGLPPLPSRMQRLSLDDRGYPVPYFVAVIDGKPDFRVADRSKWARCINNRHCWVCGEVVGKHLTYVIGPMCAVNRTTSEPGCHLDCAIYSAIACPFLTLPKAQRREANLLPERQNPGGIMIPRNPGVTCLWTTQTYKLFNAGNGYLFELGEPSAVRWYAEKAPATRAQVLVSIDSGMPALRTMADLDMERGLRDAHTVLDQFYQRMLSFLPDD